MFLFQLIDVVDTAYPDGKVGEYYRDSKGTHGDGLAKFIAVELTETFDASGSDELQLAEAERVISVAIEELEAVRHAIAGKLLSMGMTGRSTGNDGQ